MTSITTSCIIGSITTTNKQRVTLFINPAIAMQARAQAIIEQITLTQIVEKALIQYLPKETVIKKIDLRKDVNKNDRVSKRNSYNTGK